MVPAPRVVEQPQTVDELPELLEVPLRDPVAPGGADVLDLRGHLLRRRVSCGAPQVLPLTLRRVGEVPGVRAAGAGKQLRVLVQPGRCELPDRLQHHEAGPAVVLTHLPDQALVHERAQCVENVDVVQALDPARHAFDRLEGGAGEHREHREQTLLGRVEHLVAPGDGVAQRLLSDAVRRVLRPAAAPAGSRVARRAPAVRTGRVARSRARSRAAGRPVARRARRRPGRSRSVSRKSGLTARARSTNSSTASDCASRSTETCARSVWGSVSGGTGKTCSPLTCSASRLVTSCFSSGQSRRSSAIVGAASVTCSKLSRSSRIL